MEHDERAPTGPLGIAFAGVVVCFVATTAYSELRSAAIGRAADEIAARAAPAIEHLAAARAELRHFDLLVREHVREDGEDAQPLATSWQQAEEELRAYEALPVVDGEGGLRDELHKELADLRVAVDRFLAAVADKDRRSERAVADELLRPAVAHSTAAGLALLHFHAEASRRAALRIERVRASAMWIAFALDAAAGVLTALTAWLLVRSMRRHAEIVGAEHQRVREKSAELELFSSRVAHDIVGPVSAAMIALDAAERVGEAGDRHTFVTRARRSLLRAAEISRALLAFAQSGAKPNPDARADLAAAVAAVMDDVQMAAAIAGVAVRTEIAASTAVACDGALLVIVLENLVQNAIKYTRGVPEPRVVVRARDAGTRVRVEVEDNGTGLPSGVEANIFEPFVRGTGHEQPGIGLGLATVKRVAVAHGGAVGVTSRPGLGCTFWFELPKAA